MPIYEYGCKSCGVTFERFQRIADEPISEFEYCPNQHEGCDIQRLISAPSLVKGLESTPTAAPSNPAHNATPSPETLMANRTKSMQQQIQQRLQSFMKFAREKGK